MDKKYIVKNCPAYIQNIINVMVFIMDSTKTIPIA